MQESFDFIAPDNKKTALIVNGSRHSYHDVNDRIDRFARGLLEESSDLDEERIALLIPASLDYVTALFGIWRAGGIAIPLNASSAVAELEHYFTNAGVTRLIVNKDLQDPVTDLCEHLKIDICQLDTPVQNEPTALPKLAQERRAMILFTSGTTNKPKGVVITHKAIRAQVTTLVNAWHWTEQDVIPLFLPLHHIHGIINVLCCALWVGATVDVMPKLDVPKLCKDVSENKFNLFMAVPTIYVKLIEHITDLVEQEAANVCDGFGRMRLNVSGSAACPVKVFDQWRDLTGQSLLERYGMTEVGMAISNPYNGERRAGFVGQPLPGVTVQLFDDNENVVTDEQRPGEIRMKGDNVFLEYWNNSDATAESFVDGWFRSGDIAVVEDNYIRIMGRSSIDIIKSGGYKLSALEIEGVLLTHDDIKEVAVLGVPDDTWGEAVAAVVSLQDGASLDIDSLRSWCQGKVSSYKAPKFLTILDTLPRNAMGKVTKPDLAKLI